MRGQGDLFDPIRMLRDRLRKWPRLRSSYEEVLKAAERLPIGSGGRFAGLERMSNTRAIAEFGIDKRIVPGLARVGAVTYGDGGDLCVVGWWPSPYGKQEAFRLRQADLARRARAKRWGPRDPDRDPDRVVVYNSLKSLDNALQRQRRPPEDLPSRDLFSGSDPESRSSKRNLGGKVNSMSVRRAAGRGRESSSGPPDGGRGPAPRLTTDAGQPSPALAISRPEAAARPLWKPGQQTRRHVDPHGDFHAAVHRTERDYREQRENLERGYRNGWAEAFPGRPWPGLEAAIAAMREQTPWLSGP